MGSNQLIEKATQMLERIMTDANLTAQHLAQAATHILASHRGAQEQNGTRLSSDARLHLQKHIHQALNKTPCCNGAGFASYTPPCTINTSYWTLEWWFKEGNTIQQSQLERNQDTRERLDFRFFDWFRGPAQDLRPRIEGPYVDYICNGAYTITVAHPVVLHGSFMGVAAVDVLVATLDRLLLPVLGNIGKPALILNRDARVITSTMPRIRCGDLWKPPQNAHCIESENHPLRLILPVAPQAEIQAAPA